MANEITVRVKAEDQASTVIKGVEKNATGLGKVLGDVGKIAGGFLAANVVAGGVQKLTGFMNDSIEAAKESKLVNAQLEAVLKSTGNAAGVTADQVAKLAGKIEKQSLFEDEAILKGQNLLLTFTNIGNAADGTSHIFDDATQIMVDMAQAMGTDASGAAIQLGKALNDPTNGISALTRVGVTFTEEQKKQIETMQEAGDIAGAQAVIIAELNKEFGGSAKAASDAAGASEKYKDRMNDLKEQIGEQLLPVQLKWQEAQALAIGFIAEKAIPVLTTFIDYIKFTAEEGDQLNDMLTNLPGPLQGVALAFGELTVYLTQGREGFEGNQAAVSKLGEQLIAMAEVVQATSAVIRENWDSIEKVAGFVFPVVGGYIEAFIARTAAAVEAVASMVSFVDNILHTEWSAAWNDMKDIAGLAIDGVIAYIDGLFAGLPGMLYKRGSDAGRSFLNGLKDAAGSLVPDINLPNLNPMDFRADGGPVSGGKPYIVGERGPELFVPSQSGGIVPNGQLGGSVNVTMHVENLYGDQASGKRVGNDIGWALMLRGAI